MKTEGGRRRCTDVRVIPHHLEMYGKDRRADIDEYHKIKQWIKPQLEPCLYCKFNIKHIYDCTLSVALRSNNTCRNGRSSSVFVAVRYGVFVF